MSRMHASRITSRNRGDRDGTLREEPRKPRKLIYDNELAPIRRTIN